MLLCRLAESTFWLARYLERAEDLARALLVWEQLRLDMAGRETPGWQALGPLAGVAPDEAALLDRRSLVARIILDRESFSSVLGSLSRARENLRVTRSLMPSECWHTLNALYLRLERLAPEGPPAELGASLAQVVASAQQLAGQVAAAMLRDESYAFLRLGIYLERADMTLRIAIAIAEELIPADQPLRFEDVRWTGLLKSVGAYQAYRRRYHARAEFANVVDLLLIEPAFPRSLAHALQQIGREIEGLPANEAPRAALRAAASVHAPSNRAGWLQLAEVALADLANLSTVLGATYFAPTLAAPSAGADGVRARPARTTGLVQSNQSPDSEVAQT
jgi:uncharacterized alpha-E superfamily protein